MTQPESDRRLDSDHNLLFGVLALQAGILDASQFADACSAWATRVNQALAEVLVERGWLTIEDRAEVDRLVARKVRKQNTRQVADTAKSPLAGLRTGAKNTPLSEAQATIDLSLGALNREERKRGLFERKSLYATGGMGQIWKARDPQLDRDIAIKTLRPEVLNDHKIRERFLREARVMGQLSHPGIVPIYFLNEDDPAAPYYAMKFLQGRTLEDAIVAYHQQPNPVAFRDLLGHFADVCQTIAFAHNNHVIHRDLKPRNIIIGDFGESYVLDWGLAKYIDQPGSTPASLHDTDQALTQAGQLLGTPAYIPPEQLAGSAAGPLTDIYALGAILYEILTGRPPYQGNTALEVLKQVSRGEIKPPSQLREGVPRGLEEICLKATAGEPAHRYQTATVLTRALRDWLADELVRSEAALRESEAQIRLLLDSTAEAIYGTDLAGNCIFSNPSCARILGFQEPRELLGKHMHRLMHHHRADGTAYPVEECRIYQAFRDGRGTHVTDEVYWRADGTPFPVEYWSYPVLRDGQLVGCVVSFLDITERINRERELLLAKQTAEQTCQAARADLDALQRQVRGSLDEIKKMTAKLQDAELSAEQRSHLEGMTTTLQTLLASTGSHALP